MPDTVRMRVGGLQTIDAALHELPRAVQDEILGDALHASADVFRKGIAEKIHGRSGRTADDLVIEVQVKSGDVAGAAAVGGTRGKAGRSHVLRFLERGTKPHTIPKKGQPRAGQPMKRPSFGGRVFSKIKHPGTHAQAPMRITLADHGQAAVAAFGHVAWDGIRTVAARFSGRT